MDFHLCL